MNFSFETNNLIVGIIGGLCYGVGHWVGYKVGLRRSAERAARWANGIGADSSKGEMAELRGLALRRAIERQRGI